MKHPFENRNQSTADAKMHLNLPKHIKQEPSNKRFDSDGVLSSTNPDQ